MKQKIYAFITLVSCIAMGWALGYLRFPYLEQNAAFGIGFIACLGFVSFVISLLSIWNKHSLLLRLIGKETTKVNSESATTVYRLILMMFLLIIALGGGIAGFMIYQQSALLKAQIQNQGKHIREQGNMIASVRESNLVFLINDIVNDIRNELTLHPNSKLSNITIEKIADLSASFKPYRYFDSDSSESKLSPERGKLLLALAKMEMDASIFSEIKRKTTFSGADLKGVDLRGMDLSGADLQGASLKDADLRNANLSNTNLKNVDLWGAKLSQTNLSDADMKRANLQWANLNNAILKSANLNGANLTSAQLIKADLYKATCQWTKLEGTMLKDANLEHVDFLDGDLSQANLTNANLHKARLRRTNLSETIFFNTELTHVELDKNWFELLNEWQTIGANAVREQYKIAAIDSPIYRYSKFRLEKIESKTKKR